MHQNTRGHSQGREGRSPHRPGDQVRPGFRRHHPQQGCLIPDLLKPLPYKPFACSAIDALVYATESFLSPHRKTTTSELFSEKAMDMILKGFKLIDEKGPDARFEYLDEFVTAPSTPASPF